MGRQIHAWLQRSVGGLKHFEQECEERIGDLLLLVENVRRAGISLEGAKLVEVGTGWYPALPMGLYLCGAGRVHSYDIQSHLDLDLCRRAMQLFESALGVFSSASGVSLEVISWRHEQMSRMLAQGESLEDATCGVVKLHAPADARATELSEGSMDVVFSNNTLEHIPREDIAALMKESHRVLRPGGVVIHNVDCADHYSHFDPAIGPLNYLRYSPEAWRKWDNAFLYQNRLRASDFLELTKESGLEVVRERKRQRGVLATVEVDPSFTHYAAEDLCVTRFDFIATKTRAQTLS